MISPFPVLLIVLEKKSVRLVKLDVDFCFFLPRIHTLPLGFGLTRLIATQLTRLTGLVDLDVVTYLPLLLT